VENLKRKEPHTMRDTKSNRKQQPSFELIQDAQSQIRELVSSELREAALALVHGLFMEEVEALCGKPFSRKGEDGFHRGGWDPSSVKLQGQRIKVKKPRVKGNGAEVELQSHAALQGYDLLSERIQRHMMAGVSTRKYDGLLDELSGGLGLKKSSVSKAFVRGSKEALEQINGRSLEKHPCAL
jgi:putative transposase